MPAPPKRAAGRDRSPAGRSERRTAERKPREERWAELIETATRVFYEKGYEASSLQDIAERLGMLKGSLYYYIDSKEDLLYEVISAVHRDGLAVITAAAAEPSDPLRRLETVVRRIVEHTIAHLVSTTVFLHELDGLGAERRRQILGSGHAYQTVFRNLIIEAQEAGVARPDLDPTLAGLSILGSINWVYRWVRPEGPATPTEIAAELAELAVRSVATPKALAARDRRAARD